MSGRFASPLIRGLVRKIIDVDPDFEVTDEAGDGAEAIIRAMTVLPAIIIRDIEMPKMDGFEVLKRLKLLSRDRVIVLSAGAQLGTDVARKARQRGVADVIPEPSGPVGFDCKAKRGHVMLSALNAVAGLPPPDFRALAIRIAARRAAVD